MSLPPIQSLNLPSMRNSRGSINPVVEILPDRPELIFYNKIPYSTQIVKEWGYYVIMTSIENRSLHIKTAFFNHETQRVEHVNPIFLCSQQKCRFPVKPFNVQVEVKGSLSLPQTPRSIFYNGNEYTALSEYYQNGVVCVDTINALGVQLHAYAFHAI